MIMEKGRVIQSMKILVTGFDPFGEEKLNPAIEAVKLLPDMIEESQVIKLELPTVFHKSAEKLSEAIEQYDPDYILSIGQAGGRAGISFEKVAINIDEARIPDNDGNQPIAEAIQTNGETAYFSQHPLNAMTLAVRAAGLPASISYTAGTYVCNHIMYQALYLSHTKYPKVKAGFIHVPFLTEQVTNKANQASMSLVDIVSALTVSIATLVKYHGKKDVQLVAGETH